MFFKFEMYPIKLVSMDSFPVPVVNCIFANCQLFAMAVTVFAQKTHLSEQPVRRMPPQTS
jgi:hypothetical protein